MIAFVIGTAFLAACAGALGVIVDAWSRHGRQAIAVLRAAEPTSLRELRVTLHQPAFTPVHAAAPVVVHRQFRRGPIGPALPEWRVAA